MDVIVADDQPEVRSALRLVLSQEPGIEHVGEAGHAGELLLLIAGGCPDLVLLDWELPGLRGDELVDALRAHCPSCRVIVLSGRPEARLGALAARADDFISKQEPPERLLASVRSLYKAKPARR